MNKNIIKLIAILVMCFVLGAVLVSCAGADGKDGINGVNGKDGVDGVNGADGKDGQDGQDGKDGKDGLGIQSVVKNDAGELVITFTDGTVQNVGKVDGDDAFVCTAHTFTKIVVESVDGGYYTLGACTACGWAEILCGHKNTHNEIVDPTCVEDGYTKVICDDCDELVDIIDETLALGHDAPDFDENNLSDKWTLDINNSGLCDCEWERTYTATCLRNGCGADVHEVGTAIGHIFGAWEPTTNNSNACDCEWIPIEIAECTRCQHDTCFDSREIGSAKGHNWSAWVVATAPTATTAGEAVRVCEDCGAAHAETDGTDVLVLPALNTAGAYTYAESSQASCTVDGAATYTYNADNTIVIDVVLPAHGHSVDDNSTYNVTVLPTAEANGAVEVECADCGETLTMALPALTPMYLRVYMIQHGDCVNPDDIYTINLTDLNEEIEGSVVVTFAIDGGYEHDEAPAQADCQKVNGINKTYWVYKCSKCGNWIVAYYENN